MDSIKKILIVEDELRIATLLADYLKAAGMEADIRTNGVDGFVAASRKTYDLLLLDLMLPGLDGMEICKKVRLISDVPIIMITARIEEDDRLRGLGLGADDYICKPFSPREVVARVTAVLRRSGGRREMDRSKILLNSDLLSVSFEKRNVQLTSIEFRILHYLHARSGQILSRCQIMDAAYDDGRVVSDRTVDSHIKKLRGKLAEIGAEECITSVYSVGYRYDEIE